MDRAFTDEITQAIQESISLLGDSIIFNTVTYKGIVNEVELVTELGDGGFMQDLAMQIVLPVSTPITGANIGQTLMVGAQKARIHKVLLDNVSVILICTTATK